MAATKKGADHMAKVRDALAKQFGKTAVIALSDERAKSRSAIQTVIPTGIDVIDRYLCPVGGLATGRISEVYGEEGVGKSSLCYQIIGAAQRFGADCYHLDPELSFDDTRAPVFGVDLNRLTMLQPPALEDLFEMVKTIGRLHDSARGPFLLTWDTIAATRTRAGVSAEAGSRKTGEVPRIMSEQLANILDVLAANNGHLLAFNQVRANIGVMFGDTSTTPGGKAPKFYASWRLALLGGKAIKAADNTHTGKIITALVRKTRFSEPYRKARLWFNYTTGYDNAATTIAHAKALKLMDGRAASGRAKRGKNALLEARTVLGWLDSAPAVPVPADGVARDEEE